MVRRFHPKRAVLFRVHPDFLISSIYYIYNYNTYKFIYTSFRRVANQMKQRRHGYEIGNMQMCGH